MSSISITKVEKFLMENKFVIQAFYILKGKCKYIKVFSIVTADILILSVSSEYNFVIENPSYSAFEIVPIEFDSGDDIIDKYTEYPSAKDISGKYEALPELGKNNNESTDMETTLENNYNKKILLNKLSKENEILVKDCFRQTRRLSLCFQDLKYKTCIVQDNYFCVLESEDEIVTYYIKNHLTDGKRLFFVVSSLELFYENLKAVSEDVDIIKTNIYKILDKNQQTNSDNLEKLIKRLENIPIIVQKIEFKKGEYTECIQKYKTLLSTVYEFESELLEKIASLTQSKENNSIRYCCCKD